MRLWQHLLKQQVAPAAAAYRYWRIFVLVNDGGGSVRINEVELRASAGGADLTTPSTPTTYSTRAGTSFSSAQSIDDDTGTFWGSASGQTTNQWVRYDLGAPVVVAQVAIYPNTSATTAPKDFIIQGSDDGTNFTDVKAFTNQTGWTAAWRTFDL